MSVTYCGVMSAVISGRQLLGGSFPPKRALVRVVPELVVPIVNERDQQTYYGALDYFNHEFLVQAYPQGNWEHTISFLNYKQEQRPHQRIAIIWDGASYHRSQEVKDYLQSLNTERPQPSWQLTCIRFAPNAPPAKSWRRCFVTG